MDAPHVQIQLTLFYSIMPQTFTHAQIHRIVSLSVEMMLQVNVCYAKIITFSLIQIVALKISQIVLILL